MNPPYPTTPVPRQGVYAIPQQYPPQQQQRQQQQRQQQQQQHQQAYFPVPNSGQVHMQPQMQPQAQPQPQTHPQPYPQNAPAPHVSGNGNGDSSDNSNTTLSPYYPPLPYQPACQDGADGGYYYHDDEYDLLRGYDKERERDRVKDKDKTKAERARDKHRALERRPTLGDSVMAAVGRVGKVLGGERR
jgi:hypothetical protein